MMMSYVTALESFRDVVTIAEKLDDPVSPVTAALDSLPSFADPEKRRAFTASMRAVGELLSAFVSDAHDGSAEVAGLPSVPTSELVSVELERDEDGSFKGGSVSIADPDVEKLLAKALLDSHVEIVRPKSKALVMSSLLVSIVGTLDSLFLDIAALYFRANPSAMGSEPEFSLADLAAFESVEEAREELIQRKVDSLDPGIEARCRWLKARLDIDLVRLAIDWSRLFEAVQRRHLVVHTGGRVSRRYLQKVGASSEFALGDRPTVDATYLEAVLDEFVSVGASLVFATWYVLEPESRQEAASAFLRVTERMARLSRWEVVDSLCRVAKKVNAPMSLVNAFMVYRWLAMKHLRREGEAVGEIEQWDVSALGSRWRLAQLCLLDDHDEAATLAAGLLQSGHMSAIDLLVDPFFASIRSHPDLVAAVREAGIAFQADEGSE